jgi:hypothetical protein
MVVTNSERRIYFCLGVESCAEPQSGVIGEVRLGQRLPSCIPFQELVPCPSPSPAQTAPPLLRRPINLLVRMFIARNAESRWWSHRSLARFRFGREGGATQLKSGEPSRPISNEPPPSPAPKTINQVGRFLSLPWLILIFVFGFLPWCEVSCNAKDVHLRVTQSGYQTLYGGVSSSYNVMEIVRDKASAELNVDREQFAKTLEAKRTDLLASFSPFAVIFWAAALAFLLIVLLAPLGFLRLKFCGPLAALMLSCS